MNLNQIPDSVWLKIVDGNVQVTFEFVALGIFMSGLRQRRRTNQISPAQVVTEIKTFFSKYGTHPSAMRDLEKIAKL